MSDAYQPGVDISVRPMGRPTDPYADLKEWSPPVQGKDQSNVTGSDPYGDLKEWEPPQPKVQQKGPSTSPMEHMAIDLQNQFRAAAQGTTASISAHEKNYLGEAQESDTGPVYTDDKGNFIPLDAGKHVVLVDPEDRKLKVYARSDKTNENPVSSAGHLLMAGSGAGRVGEVVKKIPEAVKAAERVGVKLPRAIATNSLLGRLTGQTIAKSPFGGKLTKAIEKSQEELGGSVERAIEASGGNPSAAAAGESFKTGIETFFKPGMKSVVGGLYDRVDAGVNNSVLHRLDATTKAAGDIAGRHASYGDTWGGKGADLIVNAIQRPEGLSYQAIKNLRTRIGEMLDTGVFPEGTSESELRSIYGGLSDDLRGAVKRAGTPGALADFERANAAAKYSAAWKDKISKVLGSASRSEEGVAGAIFRMAQKGDAADLSTLNAARKAVPAEAWKDITANAISRLGKDKAGNFSPQRFISDYGNLSEAGKRALFGGAGASDLVPFLNDIAEVSEKFVSAGKLANVSGTAGHGMTAGLAVAGERILESVMSGNWKEPVAIISTGLGVAAASKILATPATVASMARWSRAYDTLVRKPGPAALASFNIATRNLANTASDHIGVPAATIEQNIKQAMQVGQEGQNQ